MGVEVMEGVDEEEEEEEEEEGRCANGMAAAGEWGVMIS